MLDEYLEILADSHRRQILFGLRTGGPDDGLAEIPTDGGSTLVTDTRQQIDLHHNHLPKLANAELIRWDRTANEITPGPRFEEIEPLLDLLADYSDD